MNDTTIPMIDLSEWVAQAPAVIGGSQSKPVLCVAAGTAIVLLGMLVWQAARTTDSSDAQATSRDEAIRRYLAVGAILMGMIAMGAAIRVATVPNTWNKLSLGQEISAEYGFREVGQPDPADTTTDVTTGIAEPILDSVDGLPESGRYRLVWHDRGEAADAPLHEGTLVIDGTRLGILDGDGDPIQPAAALKREIPNEQAHADGEGDDER